MPDSTQRRFIEENALRWYAPDIVPITGLVRERSSKTTTLHTWPNGKVSKDFPMVIGDEMKFELTLLEYGHGAKPKLADRMRSAVNAPKDAEAGDFFTD
jgi:hypothetical protein